MNMDHLGMEKAKRRVVVLLTACVAPNGMAYTALQDPQIRKNQYLDAIDFYLRETRFNIVFCENSGVDLWDEISSDQKEKRLEYITFNGNNYNKQYGKGYGEAIIIRHALQNSNFIRSANYIIKITGRIKVLNINDIIVSIPQLPTERPVAKMDFSSDVGRISSVCFLASKSWLLQVMEKYSDSIRDDGNINFEGALFKGIVDCSDLKIMRFNPILEGVSAGFNIPYRNRGELIHKNCHYHILCSIYKVRKDFWNLFLSFIPFCYYEGLCRMHDLFATRKD